MDGEVIVVTSMDEYLECKAAGATFESCSHLFWEYNRILRKIQESNPNVKFLLENVRMNKVYSDMISETLGVEPIMIDSSLTSPQQRKRLYWCNWDTCQPEDRNINVSDILLPHNDKDICGEGWHKWWYKNKDKQLRKSYSRVCNDGKHKKAITMVARQYACWAGNFVLVDAEKYIYRKMSVNECCILNNAPLNYFKVSSNAQAYKMLGNAWEIGAIIHLLNCLFYGVDNKSEWYYI